MAEWDPDRLSPQDPAGGWLTAVPTTSHPVGKAPGHSLPPQSPRWGAGGGRVLGSPTALSPKLREGASSLTAMSGWGGLLV